VTAAPSPGRPGAGRLFARLRRLSLPALGLVACALFAPPALAGPGFFFGVNDDTMKWSNSPEQVAAAGTDLGVRAFRMTLPWTRGERSLAGSNLESFDRVIAARGDQRIVLNAGWLGANTPVNASQRAQFCGYVRSTLDRYPQIHDVVIWNEVNKTMFFRPQFTRDGKPASPALYEKLLATCYDALHALRGGDVNVITSMSPRGNDNPRAISNVSLSPVTFIRELGRAYRASGRRKPIFDTWGQNAYGASSSEPVSKRHAGGTISQGDYGKLLATIKAAFRRTAQPLPSATGRVRIWYLETGFQTSVDGAMPGLYQGRENVNVLSPVAQAQQLSAAIDLAYCQPAVEALFNFELADDPALAGWQSGLLWANWTPKPSYATVRDVALAANAGTLPCD
jgi:hypothetical protein